MYPRKYEDYVVAVDETAIPAVCTDEKDDLMGYAEDEYLMISGIQHFKFLPTAVGFDTYRTAVGRKCAYSHGGSCHAQKSS